MTTISLPINDAAALCVGRVILAWGNLDFRIETLMIDGYHIVNDYYNSIGHEFSDCFPIEGRSKFRLSLLRKYFVIITENDKLAISEFDRLKYRWRSAEKIRSSLAHGLTVFGQDDEGDYVSSWLYSQDEANGIPTRKHGITRHNLYALNNATIEIDSLEKEFSDLYYHFRTSFLLKSMYLRVKNVQDHELRVDLCEFDSILCSQEDENVSQGAHVKLSSLHGRPISF